MDLNNTSILVTGGTGSFGKKFIGTLLAEYPSIKRLVIYSRDELKQFEMSQTFSKEQYDGIRYFLGDVRDKDRLRSALRGIDVVIHAAALKQVPAAEYNPFEFIKTNIIGAENIIEACLESNVKKVIALSTDKAAAPINLYGATKLCSDKLFIAANNIKGEKDVSFSIVRYGNVMGSRGSVIPFFIEKKKGGVLPVTDEQMTRFNISLQDGVDLVVNAMKDTIGGEIIVPKLPSYKITELAKAIGPDCEHKIVGIRPGEKIHEDMIIASDAPNTLEFENHYIIHPQNKRWEEIRKNLVEEGKATEVADGFSYNSGTNTEWLDSEQLNDLIQEHL